MDYNNTERNAMIQNGYNAVTQGNGTLDAQWPACVGCAVLSRSFERTGQEVPGVCRGCFERYCWNGTTASGAAQPYWPQMKLAGVNVRSAAGGFAAPSVLGFLLVVGVSGLLLI
jgi:lysophospholipase